MNWFMCEFFESVNLLLFEDVLIWDFSEVINGLFMMEMMCLIGYVFEIGEFIMMEFDFMDRNGFVYIYEICFFFEFGQDGVVELVFVIGCDVIE